MMKHLDCIVFKNMKREIIEQFSDGIRMLMVCQRNKEGRPTNKTDRASRRKISKNSKEFFEILEEFKNIKEESMEKYRIPMRIYSCVNKRDIKKAIRNFKQEQLDADYYDEESKYGFYFDIKNRWLSSLMKQNCRTETQFLIDVDKPELYSIFKVINHLEEIGVEIIVSYETKNGYHIITKPFNPNLFNSEFGEIKKDALLLLDY